MHTRWRPLVAGLVVLAMAVVAPAALAQDRDDLAAARDRLADIESELDAAVDEADGAELELADAEQRLDEVEAVVNLVARRVDDQQDRVHEAEERLERFEASHRAARAAVRHKAVQLYTTGRGGDLFTLLASPDIESALQKSDFLRLVDTNDQAVIESLVQAAGRTDAAREGLAAEATALEDLLTEQQALMARAEELRQSRALAAATAQDEVSHLEEEHDDAESEAARLEQVIAEAEAAAAARAAAARTAAASPATSTSGSSSTPAPPPPPPVASGGGYIWPACGAVTSEFGYRWGRLHAGLDVDDTFSSSIVAAQSGTVISAGWNSGGYGNLTLISHGDGLVTAYAHQSAIHVSTGQSVSRGQSIGVIGTTGASTGTHLHFETRVGGSAVNPRNYLSGGC